MAQKKPQTTFTVSQNLKTAMAAKGRYPQLQPDMAVYDGAQSDQHLLHGQYDDGSFRTINTTNSGITFDFVVSDDAELVRIWTERELQVFIGNLPGVGGSSGVLNGQTWTWTIIFNGQNVTGTDNNKPDAIAEALITILNQL